MTVHLTSPLIRAATDTVTKPGGDVVPARVDAGEVARFEAVLADTSPGSVGRVEAGRGGAAVTDPANVVEAGRMRRAGSNELGQSILDGLERFSRDVREFSRMATPRPGNDPGATAGGPSHRNENSMIEQFTRTMDEQIARQAALYHYAIEIKTGMAVAGTVNRSTKTLLQSG